MNLKSRVASLKQQLETLFPGKFTESRQLRHLPTGLREIDQGISRGIARQRISQWTGHISSGKTTLLRTAINNWCKSGLNVAYVDTQGKLLAYDWANIDNTKGKFWVIHPPETNQTTNTNIFSLLPKTNLYLQESLWSTNELIRCNAFDIVILDLGNINTNSKKQTHQGITHNVISNQLYVRLQRALDKSKAALIIVQDQITNSHPANIFIHTSFSFSYGQSQYKTTLAGIIAIMPTIECTISRNGLSQRMEVTIESSAENCLFTHPQISDRRTSNQ
jgi:RecA/RadA recombinase